MRFKISPEVFEKFPDLVVALPIVLGFDNNIKQTEALAILRKRELDLREELDLETLWKENRVTTYMDVFSKFGVDPNKFLPAHIALAKRVLEGGNLPDINPVVNLYNAMSLKYLTPFGGEDLDTLFGDFELKIANGGERWIPIGGGKPKVAVKGELVWGDDLGLSTRALNWRQCDRTKMTNQSKNGYFVMDGFQDVNRENIAKAVDEFVKLMTQMFGGSGKIYWLDKVHPEFEIDFESKEIALEVKEEVKAISKSKVVQGKNETKFKSVGEAARIIYESIKNLNLGINNFTVEHPADEEKGDYSTNIAMVMGGNPRVNAEKIVEDLKKDKELGEVVDLENISVAGPGFINFFLSGKYISSKMLVKNNFGQSDWMKGKKVLVEYSSPNIAKRFSVGHFRSTLIGQALFNLYKNSGAEVTNDNHLGDWGTQFGMIIAAVKEWGFDWTCEDPIGKLEDLYVRFNKEMAEKPEVRDKAREEFLKLEKGDVETREIWRKSVDVSMKEFGEIYKKLDISFEHQNGESIYEKMMPAIIEECKQKKVAIEGGGGALIVPFEKDGKEYYPPAMLLKSDGSTTYFTRDLATIRKRLDDDDLKSDLYIYEVGSEQTMHFRQLFEAVDKLGWANKNIFKHVQHGLLTLPEGKMSTRKGNTIKLEDLLGRAEEKSPELAIASVKYNELKRSPVMNYVFDWEEALSMEGNSAPYINYAYVRANKILQGKEVINGDSIFEGEEKDLARFLLRFVLGEEVEKAASGFAPQSMCTYVYELAKRFNGFYERNKVLGDSREGQRLALVSLVREVIKIGLETLGIKVVEAM